MKPILKALALVVMLAAFAAPISMATPSVEDQPHMRSAIEHLKAARAELEHAADDKGGHRSAAIKATDDAIHHTQEGIEFANHHHH